MQLVVLNAATDANGVVFTPINSTEIRNNGDMALCPLITGLNWNGGTVALHVQRPGSSPAEWYDTGVVLSSTNVGAIVRVRPGYNYRLVPSAPGASLALTFMIH